MCRVIFRDQCCTVCHLFLTDLTTLNEFCASAPRGTDPYGSPRVPKCICDNPAYLWQQFHTGWCGGRAGHCLMPDMRFWGAEDYVRRGPFPEIEGEGILG